MIMIKTKVITLLIALMCVSPVSGSFMVICYGGDGHVAVEPVGHDHCACAESEGSSHEKDSGESSIGCSSDHGHCKDVPASSSVVISDRKKIKSQISKVFGQSLCQRSFSNHMTFSFRYPITWNAELSSFFTPLGTIILLA